MNMLWMGLWIYLGVAITRFLLLLSAYCYETKCAKADFILRGKVKYFRSIKNPYAIIFQSLFWLPVMITKFTKHGMLWVLLECHYWQMAYQYPFGFGYPMPTKSIFEEQ